MSTYPDPQDEIVAELLPILEEAMREAYEEHAGILEFDAGLSRGHAECVSLLRIIRRYFTLTKRG